MHECRLCGMECDCDGEDLSNPQPSNCAHLDPSLDACEAEYDEEMEYDLIDIEEAT